MAALAGLDEETFKRASMSLWCDYALVKAHGEASQANITVEKVTF